MQVFELVPTNGRKSFGHKAKVFLNDDGTQTLMSYNSMIIQKNPDGKLIKLYHDKLSKTTMIHLKTFCGITAKEFEILP